MNDPLAVLESLSERLETTGLPHMVTGAVALNYYAQPRMTRDIDLVVSVEPETADLLVATLQDVFYLSDEAVRLAAAGTAESFELVHLDRIVKVDLFVTPATDHGREAMRRRRALPLPSFSTHIVTVEDLLLATLAWSERFDADSQERDLQNLMDSVRTFDWDYLESWAPELKLDGLLGELRP